MINNIDITKIVVSNKLSLCKNGFKYFIGYKDAKKLDLYAYFFQKWVHIERNFDDTNYMSFLIKDDELLEKCNEIWEKLRNDTQTEFDSEPVYHI